MNLLAKPLDNIKLALITLVILLVLLCSAVSVGLQLSDQQPSAGHSQRLHDSPADASPADASHSQHAAPHSARDSDDGVVRFVSSHQNHLMRLEHSQRDDNQSNTVVYQLLMSWSEQAILLFLCGLLGYLALSYQKNSFRDRFATLHRHRLQRQYLQFRFVQGYLIP